MLQELCGRERRKPYEICFVRRVAAYCKESNYNAHAKESALFHKMAISFIHKALCRRVAALHCALNGYNPPRPPIWAASANGSGLPDTPVSSDPPPLGTFPRRAGTVSEGKLRGKGDMSGNDGGVGTYVQHPKRDARRQPPHRSPRPGAGTRPRRSSRRPEPSSPRVKPGR